VVHLATRRRKTSCGAQKQLSHLHSGPFGHATKENQLQGPETAISPAQWTIWPPDEGEPAAGPRNSYLTCTVVHFAIRRRRTSCGAQKQLSHLHSGLFGHPTKENQLRSPETTISPAQWSIWPPNGKPAAGPRNSYLTCTVVHCATRRRKTSCGAQKQLSHLHSGVFGHLTENQLRGPETAISPAQWSI
jgi:hypothetical protein